MQPSKETLLINALALPEADRAEVAARLDESLVGSFDDPEIEAAWKEAIQQRREKRHRGDTQTVPWEEVQDGMRKTLDEPTS